MTSPLKRQPADEMSLLPAGIAEAISTAQVGTVPYRHFLFRDVLPRLLCHQIIALPVAPARIEDTHGKRDSHNDVRRFFSPENQQKFSPMREVAEAFQSNEATRAIEKLCGISLKGGYLRIEYCQDMDGFWLEPHMDIPEKLITLQVYLNTDRDAATLGTDMYDADKRYHSRAPGSLGEAMAFLPKEPKSWHGFEKRPIASVRRSLIVNYVTDDWRARHELSFPEAPIA